MPDDVGTADPRPEHHCGRRAGHVVAGAPLASVTDAELRLAFVCGDRRGPVLTEMLRRLIRRGTPPHAISAAIRALLEDVIRTATGAALEQLLRVRARALVIAGYLARQRALIRERRQQDEARQGRERIDAREPQQLPDDVPPVRDTSPRGPPLESPEARGGGR
jgi:hypothetical protein